MTHQPLKPFLKWPGGKRWLFESGQFSLPNFSGRYIEPFLGGGAVFFERQPSNAVLSDANGRLIELFVAMRYTPTDLERKIEQHASAHTKNYYYHLRSKDFIEELDRAAQFFYLNRTCWNGLYRENLNGKFNVPIGTKKNVLFPSDNFSAWSRALKGTKILHRDFEAAINEAEAGDFIFVDPPYTVRHNMNGFVKYNQNIFAWRDQVRLRDALLRAMKRGVDFAMTNADHESIRELYTGIGEQRQLARYSVIAGKSAYRGQSTELLVVGLTGSAL